MTQQAVPTSQAFHQPAASWAERLVFSFMRHWLVFFLAAFLLFALMPFVAPIAMHTGWERAGVLIYRLYSPTCHQLPQRSWFLFGDKLTYTLDEISQVYPYTDPLRLRSFYGTPEMGWKVAWSDRMISFYAMIPVFGLVYAAWRAFGQRLKPISFRLLALFLLPLTIDGFTHMFSDLIYGVSGGGFRDTNAWLAWLTGYAFPSFYAGDQYGTFNWWMRLVSGLLAAWAVAFCAFPWLDRLMQGELGRYQEQVAAESEVSESHIAYQHTGYIAMTTFVEGCARLRRGRSLIVMLALLGGAIALASCGSRGAQPTSELDLEATVAAMVDAKLTETASGASEEGQTGSETPEPQEISGEASTSSGLPVLITPTPDRSGEIMDFIVANTRHFKGDDDAPVTIIEFGDFQ